MCLISIIYIIGSQQCCLTPAFPYMLAHVSCGLCITCTNVSVHLRWVGQDYRKTWPGQSESKAAYSIKLISNSGSCIYA